MYPVASLPAWECGLKWRLTQAVNYPVIVTPCVGVWIEIDDLMEFRGAIDGHSLRGSVD